MISSETPSAGETNGPVKRVSFGDTDFTGLCLEVVSLDSAYSVGPEYECGG
jgi:hypothetical protein